MLWVFYARVSVFSQNHNFSWEKNLQPFPSFN